MEILNSNEKLKKLKEKANRLPLTPGVYIMKDKGGNIIYIGKAVALKNRVTQYFGSGNQHTEKVRKMVSNVDDFDYILCDSEFEALILENSLIKQNKPKYNILLKDDKGYHYIKISKEKWPKITSANTIDKNGEFIGPYNSSYVVKDTVDEILKIFKLPTCNRSFDRYSKPCLNYHIGRCDAPCKGNISVEDYNETVNSAVQFLRHGNDGFLIKSLTEKMERAAENLDFEYAAKLRDRINAINKSNERQKVVMCTYKSQDVISGAVIGETAGISVFIFRNYRLTDKKEFVLEGISGKAELYSEFLKQYYTDKNDIPPRILFDILPLESELLSKWLSERAERRVEFIVPKAGEQLKITEMCLKNAIETLAGANEKSSREMSALGELSKLLGLESIPRYIESYDISHTAGVESVAGMVVFQDGKPLKSNYKRFKIKSFEGNDDYRSLAEVLDRRFTEYETGDNDGFKTLPDLILLDGGLGQVTAVRPILEKHNLNIPIFGMVKDSKHRTRGITNEMGDISIKPNQTVFTFITQIQDEVHRFAISYHRNLRSKKMLASELLEIEGVGKQRAENLLKHFKTLKAVKQAKKEELIKVNGITETVAENIIKYFK